jgi:hypothetical protein
MVSDETEECFEPTRNFGWLKLAVACKVVFATVDHNLARLIGIDDFPNMSNYIWERRPTKCSVEDMNGGKVVPNVCPLSKR